MPKNPPENTPRIAPYLYYEDVAAAMDWLAKAFGLTEAVRMPGPGGKIAHAEMRLADGLVMMGCPAPDYQNPKRLGHVTQSLHVYVDNVDAHYERARKAGARILEKPTNQFYGDRRYAAVDPEGHQWYFAEHVRDVSAEEMKAAMPH
ncbi:MAG: VOC family protein [Steroidobacterales bacterium]